MKELTLVMLMSLPLVAAAAAKSPDESFYEEAAQGGLAEVEQGKLAEQKGQNQAVKDFGRMMVRDHSAANDKLKAVAASKNIDLPRSPSITQRAIVGKLKVLSGDTFDRSYIEGMVKDHEEDIAEFQKEARSGRDPQAKAFAASTLPTLQAHLDKIRAIASTAGVAAD